MFAINIIIRYFIITVHVAVSPHTYYFKLDTQLHRLIVLLTLIFYKLNWIPR